MDLNSHFRAIWRHKWVVVVASILIAVLTYAVVSTEHNVYEATAQLNVVVPQSSGQSPETLAPFLAETDANLAKASPVLKKAVKLAGLRMTASQASADTNAVNPDDLGNLEVTAKGKSQAAANRLANGLSEALIQAVNAQNTAASNVQTATLQNETNSISNQLQNPDLSSAQRQVLQDQLDALDTAYAQELTQGENGLAIISPASGGPGPVSPSPKRDAAFAFVAGLVVLSELSVGYELLSDRFTRGAGEEEIKAVTDLPVLARIPVAGGVDLVEAFRTLRTSLLFRDEAHKTHTVAVVSSMPQVGKTFVSINLAYSFADLGINAALVDGDMRRPTIAAMLGIADVPGLSESLVDGNVSERIATVHSRSESNHKLDVLPAGEAAVDPAALLTGHLAQTVIPALAGFNVIVFDTPAEHYFPDAAIIAARCDATILVIDTKITKRRSLKLILEHLYRTGANPVGIVVNRASDSASGSYYYRNRKPMRRRMPEVGPRHVRTANGSRSGASTTRPRPRSSKAVGN